MLTPTQDPICPKILTHKTLWSWVEDITSTLLMENLSNWLTRPMWLNNLVHYSLRHPQFQEMVLWLTDDQFILVFWRISITRIQEIVDWTTKTVNAQRPDIEFFTKFLKRKLALCN